MATSPHPLDKLIAEARGRLAKAERDAEKARIEIAAYERAKEALGHPASEPRGGNGRDTARRRRALSEPWQKILRSIARHDGAEADLDEILGYCSEAGLEINRHSLRGQMWNYVNRGLLIRPSKGVFRLTEVGAKAAGLPAGNEDAPPNAGEAS